MPDFSDIIQFWHYMKANPRLSVTAGVIGFFIAASFYRLLFVDAQGFNHAVSLNYRAMVGVQWHEFVWAKIKFLFWLALTVGSVILAFYQLPRQFPGFVNQPTFQTQIGPPHVFQLAHAPKFLTEEIAVGDARATFNSQNFDRRVWDVIGSSRSTAPDGTKDTYFSRGYLNHNSGYVTFTNGPHSRIVTVELSDNQITCLITMGRE